ISASTAVEVDNAAPVVTAVADQLGSAIVPAVFDLGSFTDAGLADGPWTVQVNWGDQTMTTFAQSDAGTLVQSHIYAAPGSYPVPVEVTDKDGAASSQAGFQVTISPEGTTTTVKASTAQAFYGDTIQFTATLGYADYPTGLLTGAVRFLLDGEELSSEVAADVPSGTVQFMVDGQAFGDPVAVVTDKFGRTTATSATTVLPVGQHTVKAIFTTTSANFTDSSSSDTNEEVAPAVLTVTPDDQTMVYGSAMPTLTAHID